MKIIVENSTDNLFTDYDLNKKRFEDDYKDCSDFLLREAVICGVKGFFCVMDGLIDSLQLSQMVMNPILGRELEFETKQELMEMNRRLQVSVSEQLKQMELEKKNILYALANIAAKNSSYKEEHLKRLGKNCGVLAQGMQLSPLFEDKISDTYIDTIELAAPLCDIGNIGIPMEILRKNTDLTEEETAIVKTHAEIGAKLLQDLHVTTDYNDFIKMSIDIAIGLV